MYVYLHPPASRRRFRRTHLAQYDALGQGPTTRTLCGIFSEALTVGDRTATGVAASCRSCRQQVPANTWR